MKQEGWIVIKNKEVIAYALTDELAMKHIEHNTEGGMYGIAPLFCGEKHMDLVKCLKQNGIIELNPPISLDLFGKHKGE